MMDGNGALFGTLQGNTRDVLHKFTVDLPKKHGRGGQSALRFARLRMEKRHNYVRKVAETAVTLFLTNDKANVSGLILAGSADFKTELSQSDMFDQRLQAKIIKLVDVSYGGENGFNQVSELRGRDLHNIAIQRWRFKVLHWISHLCNINHFSSLFLQNCILFREKSREIGQDFLSVFKFLFLFFCVFLGHRVSC